MSVINNVFKWVPTLQHMATVKTIEMLWRNFEHKEALVNEFNKNFDDDEDSELTYPDSRALSIPTIKKLKIKLDELPVPGPIKLDLKSSLVPMVQAALYWLFSTALDRTLDHQPEDRTEAFRYFISNLCFDNFGCIDYRSILKSYVSKKEKIDAWTWSQLCLYCIEDDIMKFAKTIDWSHQDGVILNSPCPVYWYRQIYGEFPTEDMFSFEHEWECLALPNEELYDKKNMMRTLTNNTNDFCDSPRALPAFKYFRNFLNAGEMNRLFVDPSFMKPQYGDVLVFFLRSMEKNTLLESMSTCPCEKLLGLTSWPWVLFIDEWVSLFEHLDAPSFMWFFRARGIETKGIEGDCNKRLCEDFEKILRVFFRKFISNDQILTEAFWTAFAMNDLTMCRLMLEGVGSHRRKFLIDSLKVNGATIRREHNNFFIKFCLQVLKNDEERRVFWEIHNR